MALGSVAWGGFLGEFFRRASGMAFGLRQERGEVVFNPPQPRYIPYAPAIAIGTLMSFLGH